MDFLVASSPAVSELSEQSSYAVIERSKIMPRFFTRLLCDFPLEMPMLSRRSMSILNAPLDDETTL
jgi:hypothetical protein